MILLWMWRLCRFLLIFLMIWFRYFLCCGVCCVMRLWILLQILGCSIVNDRFFSLDLIVWILSWLVKGVQIFSVFLVFFEVFLGGMKFQVWVLCRWLVSLMSSMWMFFDIVMIILWIVFVCVFLLYLILLSFVMLLMSIVILLLNLVVRLVSVQLVFLMVLCSSVVVMVCGLSLSFVRIWVIVSGCVMYGLLFWCFWFLCFFFVIVQVCEIIEKLFLGWFVCMVWIRLFRLLILDVWEKMWGISCCRFEFCVDVCGFVINLIF